MAETVEAQLQLHIEPKKPIAIYELTASMSAIWRQYQNYVIENIELEKPGNAKLLVSSISPGSIDLSFIPDLHEAIAASAPVIGQIKVVSGFAGHLKGLLDKFKPEKKETAAKPDVTVKDCDDAINIVKPVAENGGTQTFNTYQGPVLIQHFTVDAPGAREIIESAVRAKSELQFPQAERRQRVPFRWFRLDTGAARQRGSSTDKGIVEEIDPEPKSVFFADEFTYLKREMVEGEAKPFQTIYYVDVEISRVATRVMSYRVVGFHGSEDVPQIDVQS